MRLGGYMHVMHPERVFLLVNLCDFSRTRVFIDKFMTIKINKFKSLSKC